MSEFLKKAYQSGRIKDLEDAFKEYPVEEEWHKGKAEMVLKEPPIEYCTDYEIGDIVFVNRYRYSEGKEGYNHLFVIIDKNNMAVPIENFGMLISSHLDKLKYEANKLLKKDEQNHLQKDSIVKTVVVYKILNNQILFKIGKVDTDKVEEYKNSFYHQIS